MAGRMRASQALLTALAGLTAYEGGSLGTEQLLAMGEEAPGETFVAALAVASRLAEEVRRLGGDPDALRRRVYDRASDLAYS